MKVSYQHDRIATPVKIANLFELWLQIHSWKRRPRLTKNRIHILNSKIQEKGYDQCIKVFKFLIEDNEYSNHIKENGHTKLRNIFNKHTWEEKVKRSNIIDKDNNNERI